MTANDPDVWFAAGVRTPFAKADGALAGFDAISLSVPVVRHMVGELHGGHSGFRGMGHGRSQPHVEQHRARSADGRGRGADDPRVLDGDGVLDQHDRAQSRPPE